ncbi:uncharacterized protein N7483_007423 [Penicillium malachiteum]|uniref:uncharacterized protein n=1 Tax=Penicillium malachiteum TaxID=1324776 RepID=UPI0025494AC0|nr:uncharacterized protein N7483_007423 [Penicillium malachiteum]KAJ5726066.1 hypothetical protein N7483_007423 [Penicillium malachiteum]
MHLQHLLASMALTIPFVKASSDSLGCFSKVAGLTDLEQYTYQSHGACIEECEKGGYAFAALKDGITCGCTNTTPALSAQIADDNCDQYCAGYPMDYCGGVNVYTVLPTEFYADASGDDSDSDDATQTASLHTTDGGIFVAATPNPSPVATTIQTAASKVITALPSASKSSIASAAITTASSSSSPSATPNAADSLRVGPVAGVLLAGLGLLL